MNIRRMDLERLAGRWERGVVTQAPGRAAKFATANTRRIVVCRHAMAAKAARKCRSMNPFLVDDG
jgi:hypothetical protein